MVSFLLITATVSKTQNIKNKKKASDYLCVRTYKL